MILTEYETIYILKPDLTEDAVKGVSEKVNGIVTQYKGTLLDEDDWGKKKLAYPIARNSRGHYVRFHYAGPADLVAELERQLRYDDNLLRFLTVKMDYDVNIESLSAEAQTRADARDAAIAEAEAATAAAEAAANAGSDNGGEAPAEA